jgi:hypothetical protein
MAATIFYPGAPWKLQPFFTLVTATLFYPHYCGRLQPFVLRNLIRRKFAQNTGSKKARLPFL